jgi:DNA (cytosine-5)-methyltransferase 1
MTTKLTGPQPTMVSLFSGAGGLDLGLERAGFETLAQIEIDADCVATLRANHTRRKKDVLVLAEKIADVEASQLMGALQLRKGELDLLAGGPPCQAFTTTGRRRALSDDRGSVVRDYLRLLRTLQPRYFLMENVTGFLSAALVHRPLAKRGKAHLPLMPDEMKGSVLRWFLRELVDAGYTVAWGVLDAVDFGVPQFRQRAFLIGTRARSPVFLPKATHVETKDPDDPRRWRTLADALQGFREEAPLVQPLSSFKAGVFEHIPPGGNWRSLPVTLRRQTMGRAYLAEGGKSGWWRRLSWDRPTPTILTMPDHSSTGLIHPSETRCLSLRECARCQTFPDGWAFLGSSRSQYRQVGNAVPVLLARALGMQIRKHMAGGFEPPPPPPVWRKASANQRLGTWGWVGPRDRARVLNRRADHVTFEPEPQQLTLT